MKYFKTKDGVYFLRIDRGEEIVETLKNFCKGQKLSGAEINGIGASNELKIGLFKTKEKEYMSKVFKGDFEITALNGNLTLMDKKTYLHLHINFCDENLNAFGGHLNSAVVSATFECIITPFKAKKINREFSEEIGLNLLKFE